MKTRSPLRRDTRSRCLALGLLALAACSSGPSTGTPGGAGPGASGDGEIAGTGVNGESGATGARPGVSAGTSMGAPAAAGATASGGASAGGGSATSATVGGEGTTMSDGGLPVAARAGLLTAGTWDDNRNLDRFLAFRQGLWDGQRPGLLPFSADDHRAALAAFAQSAPRTKLDIALLLDTTGSMGDEIAYLQAEFEAISSTIQQRFPGSDQRWSLVAYRDVTDDYVVRWFDFRTDLVDFRTHLAAQGAAGGGDFPESPEQGLAKINQLSWRGGDAAQLVFWVADAPYHDQNAASMAAAIRGARDRNLHVYPVAASGVDDFTELEMRSAAQLTGGRYTFLTDDSRIGNSHEEPHIPCYFVTKLSDALLRMVDVELTGAYREPDAAEILRSAGDPQGGVCALASGQARCF